LADPLIYMQRCKDTYAIDVQESD